MKRLVNYRDDSEGLPLKVPGKIIPHKCGITWLLMKFALGGLLHVQVAMEMTASHIL